HGRDRLGMVDYCINLCLRCRVRTAGGRIRAVYLTFGCNADLHGGHRDTWMESFIAQNVVWVTLIIHKWEKRVREISNVCAVKGHHPGCHLTVSEIRSGLERIGHTKPV